MRRSEPACRLAVVAIALAVGLGLPGPSSRAMAEPPPRSGSLERRLPATAERMLRQPGAERPHPAEPARAVSDGNSETEAVLWAWDFYRETYYPVPVRRLHVSPSTWIYVEEGLELPGSALLRLTAFAEDRALPILRQLYGAEPSPGIDDEPAISLLLLDIRDAHYYHAPTDHFVSGYFDPVNEILPEALAAEGDPRKSNGREMVYIDIGSPVDPIGDDLLRAIAHELAHLILWFRDPEESEWLEEGLSELAGFVCGLGHPRELVNLYLRNTERPLTAWSGEPEDIGKGYVFALYLYDRFERETPGWIREWLAQDASGLSGLAAQLDGSGLGLPELLLDYALALQLDAESPSDARYAFRSLALGSSQPPDGFRAPAARSHSGERPIDLGFLLSPWSARVDAIGALSRPLALDLDLPAGTCAALARVGEGLEEPAVEAFCLDDPAPIARRSIPEPADAAWHQRLLVITLNPRDLDATARLSVQLGSASTIGRRLFLPRLDSR